MKNELLDLAQDTLCLALKAGATSAEAMVAESRNNSVSLRMGIIEELEQSESRAVGLRVFAGQSSATIAGSVLTPAARERLVERVVAMAKLAPPDPFAGLADPSQLATVDQDFDQFDPAPPSPQDLLHLVQQTEQLALGTKGISKSNGAGASASLHHSASAYSNGFARTHRGTSCGLSVSLIAGEGTNMVRDYYGTSAVHFSDLEAPEKVAAMAAARTVKRINPRKLSSQSVPVIFDRRVASSLLGHFAGAINGAAIARGVSFLKEKLGQQVFNTGVTIVNDPHRLRGFASRSFDGEGIATRRMNLIDKGLLTSWVMDLRSARQLSLASTGSAARGLGSNPSPATANLHMEGGAQSPEDMIRALNKGLLITEFIGSSINSATGDYSRGASGFWIENGEVQYPVSEITVAGNLKDMFMALTPANDLEFKSVVNAPSCLIEGMTLAGR